MSSLKTIFFGTPEIAVPFLELTRTLTQVQMAITQADKPRGRGMEITPCPVKQRATELQIPVLSPEKLKDIFSDVQNTPFDLGIAVAYGKIFRPDFLALPKLGILNVHFSILPQLRGAAPVQQALIQGYTQTGVSVFWIAPGLDDGPLFLQKQTPILPQDNALSLFEKLIPLGVEALKETLALLCAGQQVKTPQTGTPTLAPMLQKEDAQLSFATLTAQEMHNKVRGLFCGPKPKVLFTKQGTAQWLQIVSTHIETAPQAQVVPGTVICIEQERGILVKCKQGSLWLTQVHPAGKKAMSAASFAHGHGLQNGSTTFINHE